MRFIMCGAGAIGGVLGGQLAKAGFEVIFIDKIAEHVAALNERGLRLKGVLGDHTLQVTAVMNAGDIDFRADDVVFMSVKSFHCAAPVLNCGALRRFSCRSSVLRMASPTSPPLDSTSGTSTVSWCSSVPSE